MKAFGATRTRLNTLSEKQVFLIVFFVAFVVRIVGVVASHQLANTERYELERMAVSLAKTGVYGNPYALPTGPSAHVSPGYTLILAALFKLWGTGPTGELAKQLFACVVTAFQSALILPVARALIFDFRAGLLAALFSALIPIKFGTETMGDWEAPYTAIALMMVSVLTLRVYQKNFTFRDATVTGLVWGISVLFNSILVLIFCASVFLGFAFSGRRLRDYLRFCSVECLIVAACLAPWAIRNYIELGAPIFTRSNVGLELRLSNNDAANADEHMNYSSGVYRTYHPLQNPREAVKVRQLGEVEYNKEAQREALAWIRSHPKKFVALTVERARLFWFYTSSSLGFLQKSKYYALSLIHLLGLVELVLLLSRKTISAVVLLVILVLYPIPNYFIHFGPRYSYPIDWILSLLACALLVRMTVRSQNIKPHATAFFKQLHSSDSDGEDLRPGPLRVCRP
jgi:hypothetical protein